MAYSEDWGRYGYNTHNLASLPGIPRSHHGEQPKTQNRYITSRWASPAPDSATVNKLPDDSGQNIVQSQQLGIQNHISYDQLPVSPPPKRSRINYTKYQEDLLNCIIAKIRYPNTMQKQVIAKRVGITRHQVKIWFQNRRRKDVIAAENSGLSGGDSPGGSSVEDQDKAPSTVVPAHLVANVLDEMNSYGGDDFKSCKTARKKVARSRSRPYVAPSPGPYINRELQSVPLCTAAVNANAPVSSTVQQIPPTTPNTIEQTTFKCLDAGTENSQSIYWNPAQRSASLPCYAQDSSDYKNWDGPRFRGVDFVADTQSSERLYGNVGNERHPLMEKFQGIDNDWNSVYLGLLYNSTS